MKHNYLKTMKEALKNICEELELKAALEEVREALIAALDEACISLDYEIYRKPFKALKNALEARK